MRQGAEFSRDVCVFYVVFLCLFVNRLELGGEGVQGGEINWHLWNTVGGDGRSHTMSMRRKESMWLKVVG